ncbi:MAG: gliding motility lipoprotein GldD [Flavobacteriaceae bacterium]
MRNRLILFFIALLLWNCEQQTLPKPKAYLSLDFEVANYQPIESNQLPIQFDLNDSKAQIKKTPAGLNLVYPDLKATVYLSYKPVQNNIKLLLTDAYTLPSKHLSKAEEIPEQVFVNPDARVYGTLFSIVGNAASQLQFFLTDSTDHFLVGSLYFYSRPNYDSLYPAAQYVQRDVERLMESLRWKE